VPSEQQEFYKIIQDVVKSEISNLGLNLGNWQLGIVESVVSPKKLKVFINGAKVSQEVPCNPDVAFAAGDNVFVIFINGDQRNKYVMSRRALITEETKQGSRTNGALSLYPVDSNMHHHAPYNFTVITGVRGGVPYTEVWILINAWYDYETKRFKRTDVDNFSFGWQMQGGGTYPGEENIGDFINQGVNLWKANGKKAYGKGDPMRDLTNEDIGAIQPDGSWREYGIMLGWNNHFMLDAYGGMTIGGAGFEIDGAGTSPFKRISLGKFSGGSSSARPVTDYQYAYNGTCWNTQHGLWNKDEDQLAGYYYGMVSPINFYDQGPTINLGSNRADMNNAKFVIRRLGGFQRPYVENWQDELEIENGEMKLSSWEIVDTITSNINPSGATTIVIPFPNSSWNKDNMIIADLVGTTAYYTEMLRNKTHTWVTGGLQINIEFGYYTNVKYTIQKLLKSTISIHPRKGVSVNGAPDKLTINADMISGTTDFNASFPDPSWNKTNTMVLGVIGVLADGNRRQLSTNVTFTPYGMYGGLNTNEYVSAKVILQKY
jgi:hypothetical protein